MKRSRTEYVRCQAVLAGIMICSLVTAGVACASPQTGTFSIAAYDSTTGELGVAVQSRVFGVGPRVAWVEAGVGAVATQAQSNESFGPAGLRLMKAGLSAPEALEWLLAHDPGRESRQVGLVDAAGRVANWTGSACMNWAGDSAGIAFTCQGNILVSREVVAGMVRAYQEHAGEGLARRLIAALEAAQAAGGDSRGQQSAAILIGRPHPDFPEYALRYVDIRVDDHPTPIAELKRLYEVYETQGLVQAHMRFAQHFQARGDSLRARAEVERVGAVLARILRSGVRDADQLNSLAWVTATNDVYLTEALEAAKLAVELKPEDTNILDTLAEVYFRMGKVGDAIEVEERASQRAPADKYLQDQLARFKGARR